VWAEVDSHNRSILGFSLELQNIMNLLHQIPIPSTLYIRPSLLNEIIMNLEKEWGKA